MARTVSAGTAVLQFAAKDSALQKVINRVQKKVKAFAGSMRRIGLQTAAVGTAILAPLTLAATLFASYGDNLDKMSARTGIAAKALSEIGYAANISGATLKQMEKATAGMSRQLFAAQRGSKAVNEALETMGLTLDDLNKMTEEQKFTTLVDSLGNIEDGTTRAGVAMQIFGLNGRYLLNMTGNMSKLRQEARDLGVTMSNSSSKLAADLTDSIARIGYLKDAVINKLGEAIAPSLIKAEKYLSKYFKKIVEFLDNNKKIIVSIAAVGVAAVGIGAAFITTGLALSGVSIVLGAVGTALTVLLNPITLVVAAVGGLTAVWLKYTDSGGKALEWIKGKLTAYYKTAVDVVKNIKQAFAANGIDGVVELMWGYIEVAFLKGKQVVLSVVYSMMESVYGVFISAKSFLQKTWETIWYALKETAIQLNIAKPIVESFNTIQVVFAKVANAIGKAWNTLAQSIVKVQNWIGEKALDVMSWFDSSLDDAGLKYAKEELNKIYEAKLSALKDEEKIADEIGKKRLAQVDAENKKRLESLKAEIALGGQGRIDQLADNKKKVDKNAKDSNQAFAESNQTALDKIKDELAAAQQAQKELIVKQAAEAQARAKATDKVADRIAKSTKSALKPAQKELYSRGTFSSFNLSNLAYGTQTQEQLTKETNKQLKKVVRNTSKNNAAMPTFG